MRETKKFSARFWVRLQRLPIFYRLLIGNAIVTVIGAVGGTLLTRRLSTQSTAPWPMVAFIVGGIILSVGVNVWIIRRALQPLYKLRSVVDKIQAEQFDTPGKLDARFMGDTDPDIYLLSIAIHEMLLQLEQRTLELRALSKQAINAQEEERLRIARGLHDDTGQALSMLIIDLERLEKRIPEAETELSDKLVEARQLATHTLTELRNVIYGLRPTMLDDLGLIPAIRWYAHSQLDAQGVAVDVTNIDTPENLPAEHKTTLYRIAQEAINNIQRHAGAGAVSIALDQADGCVVLRMQDDGRGFDLAAVSPASAPEGRLGLLGIQERAELAGGRVAFSSSPGKGTCLEIQLPLKPKVEPYAG